MRKYFFVLALLISQVAYAGGEVASLKKGQIAPFDGTLISPEVAAQLLTDNSHADELCQIETKRQLDTQEAQLSLKEEITSARLLSCQDRSKIIEETHDRELQFYRDQLDVARKQRGSAWFVTGVIGGVGLTLASAWAISMVN